MKRIVALLLAVMMVVGCMLTFASCAKEEKKTTEEQKTAEKKTEEVLEGEIKDIKAKGKLVVGVTDYAPYDFQQTAGGEWVGFDADMAKLLGEKLGVEVEFVEIDWEQKITELKTKSIDLIWNGMTMSDDLAKEMDFSKPYAENYQVIVVKAENKETFNSIDALKGKKIAAEGGSAGEAAAVEAFGEANVVDALGQTKALFEVIAGTSQAAVIDYSMAKALCGQGDYKDLVMVENVKIGEEQFAVGARQGSNLVAEINALFEETFKSGKMAELQQKYGATEDGGNAIALCNF